MLQFFAWNKINVHMLKPRIPNTSLLVSWMFKGFLQWNREMKVYMQPYSISEKKLNFLCNECFDVWQIYGQIFLKERFTIKLCDPILYMQVYDVCYYCMHISILMGIMVNFLIFKDQLYQCWCVCKYFHRNDYSISLQSKCLLLIHVQDLFSTSFVVYFPMKLIQKLTLIHIDDSWSLPCLVFNKYFLILVFLFHTIINQSAWACYFCLFSFF